MCSLPVQRIFSDREGSGMRLISEASGGPLYTVSWPPPHAARRTSLNTYVHTRHPLSHPGCRGTPDHKNHAYKLPVACGKDLATQTLPSGRAVYTPRTSCATPISVVSAKCSANLQLCPSQSLHPTARASWPTSVLRDSIPWLR